MKHKLFSSVFILSLFLKLSEVSLYCDESFSDAKNPSIKILLCGSFLKPIINKEGNQAILNNAFGLNASVVLNINESFDLLAGYAYTKKDMNHPLPNYSQAVTNEAIGVAGKYKFIESDIIPFIGFGLSINYIKNTVTERQSVSKVNRTSYLTEDLILGLTYKLNKIIEIECNTKFGLRIDKPEIDRINFNLGMGIKLFDI